MLSDPAYILLSFQGEEVGRQKSWLALVPPRIYSKRTLCRELESVAFLPQYRHALGRMRAGRDTHEGYVRDGEHP